ncbi:RimK/LysX family protein [Vibrio sonorensis]|uniref:putative ATP-dependent zinc protease n=1 Tax=Vibrio sonorensis TaxID=1004316 RepID=UPI0008D966CD|nr:RimK/LysX family protein [Vibrio sonorensis]
MKNTWKTLLPILLSSTLIACAQTGQDASENTDSKAEQTTPEVTPDTKPEVVPEPKPEPEVKPEVKPKPPAIQKKTSDGKLILGEQEWVYIPGLEQSFKARIDTGATTSSISATEIIAFERDGKDWVKFKLEHAGKKSKEIALPVQRWAKIKQSSSDKANKRAVVVGWIQIGDLKEKTEFTLADRTHLEFPILLGRSFFKDVAVIDVSKKYVQEKIK